MKTGRPQPTASRQLPSVGWGCLDAKCSDPVKSAYHPSFTKTIQPCYQSFPLAIRLFIHCIVKCVKKEQRIQHQPFNSNSAYSLHYVLYRRWLASGHWLANE